MQHNERTEEQQEKPKTFEEHAKERCAFDLELLRQSKIYVKGPDGELFELKRP